MSLKQWADNGWLRKHSPSREEIAGLMSIVDRDLQDAGKKGISAGRKADADYLDACRIKRNTVEYDVAGAATDGDATELLEFSARLRRDVLAWLERNHPRLR